MFISFCVFYTSVITDHRHYDIFFQFYNTISTTGSYSLRVSETNRLKRGTIEDTETIGICMNISRHDMDSIGACACVYLTACNN